MIAFHETLTPLVERAASATAAKWPSYVSAEDLAQEVWLWAYANQNSVESALKADGQARIYSTMLKVASSAASVEDQQASGYTKEDTYVYSVGIIETLLESVFDYTDWQSFGFRGDGQPRAKGQVNETGDVVAMLADVKAAMAEIKPDYREVLFRRHYLPGTDQDQADAMGITQRAFTSRHKRAVEALRDRLGRVNLSDLRSGWENRREALGNERSRVLTDRQYEG